MSIDSKPVQLLELSQKVHAALTASSMPTDGVWIERYGRLDIEPFGFTVLDGYTSGLKPGDLIVVSGFPAIGKTALAINIAEQVGLIRGHPVLYYSIKTRGPELSCRLLGAIGSIDAEHLMSGELTDEEWPRLSEAMAKLSKMPLHVDDAVNLKLADLIGNARNMSSQCGQLGLIVVDSLQLLSKSNDDGSNADQEMGEIASSLKALAEVLECPVIALSQLRQSDCGLTQPADHPSKNEWSQLFSIERHADIVMFIDRETQRVAHAAGVAKVMIIKNRRGPVGTANLTFDQRYLRFESRTVCVTG